MDGWVGGWRNEEMKGDYEKTFGREEKEKEKERHTTQNI